ncbi:MAG: class I SAM-dependent methyltransferase [Flavobacterium sp.]
MEDLEFTGERLMTSVQAEYGVIEHLHRYALAQKLTAGKTVLDIASGEGYGSFLLSKNAKQVYGVDIDENAVKHAQNKYAAASNVEYRVGSTDKIPLEDHSVDIVVTFETIEHHDKHELMMQEIKRVLKPDGLLLISSPEKSLYKERERHNPYHIKELVLKDFEDLLKKYFTHTHLLYQKIVVGSLIHLVDTKLPTENHLFDGDYTHIEEGLREGGFFNKPYFNLAICSNVDFKEYSKIGFSLFNGESVIQKEREMFQTEKKKVQDSASYKLGNFVMRKLSFVSRIWKK